jgi:hypothetical protein
MTFVNNIIPSNTSTPISADGDYLFFNTEKTLMNVTIYKADGITIEEKHPMDIVLVLTLTAGQIMKADSDIYFVSLGGSSVVPGSDPTKLDVSVYNTDKPTFALKTEVTTSLGAKLDKTGLNADQTALLTKLNAALTAVSTAADFDAAKTELAALLPLTRTDV